MNGIVRYEGSSDPSSGGGSFEELDLGFNVITFGKFGCNTNDPDKNRNGHDISWWIICRDVTNSRKSSVLSINRSFLWDNEKISPTSLLLMHIYQIFDAVGYTGGVNINGRFETEGGDIISQEEALNTAMHLAEGKSIAVYVYESKGKNGKVYTNIYEKMMPASRMEEFEELIHHDFQKGYIKLYDPNEEKQTLGAPKKQGATTQYAPARRL